MVHVVDTAPKTDNVDIGRLVLGNPIRFFSTLNKCERYQSSALTVLEGPISEAIERGGLALTQEGRDALLTFCYTQNDINRMQEALGTVGATYAIYYNEYMGERPQVSLPLSHLCEAAQALNLIDNTVSLRAYDRVAASELRIVGDTSLKVHRDVQVHLLDYIKSASGSNPESPIVVKVSGEPAHPHIMLLGVDCLANVTPKLAEQVYMQNGKLTVSDDGCRVTISL